MVAMSTMKRRCMREILTCTSSLCNKAAECVEPERQRPI